MTAIPVDKDGYTYLCPWPSCREPLHIRGEAWESLGPGRTSGPGVNPDGTTWSVECVGGHVIWTQADEAALDGGDTSEPDSPYNHARVVDVIGRLTAALAPLTFTERCAWCGTAAAVVIGERSSHTPDTMAGPGEQDPACIACCKDRRLVAVRTLHPQTLAERDAEPVAQA